MTCRRRLSVPTDSIHLTKRVLRAVAVTRNRQFRRGNDWELGPLIVLAVNGLTNQFRNRFRTGSQRRFITLDRWTRRGEIIKFVPPVTTRGRRR